MALLFPIWWETSSSAVGSPGVSAPNPQMEMRFQPREHRHSCQISCDHWDLRIKCVFAFLSWDAGVNEFSAFDHTRKVALLPGQMLSQKGNPWPLVNRRWRLRGIKISLLLYIQSPAWHLSEAVCTDFIKLKREKRLLQEKGTTLLYEAPSLF